MATTEFIGEKMNFQLIIKDVKGNIVAKHTLNANQSLSLKTPLHAVSFEVHSNDGHPPKKIIAKKVNDTLNLEVVDDITGEQIGRAHV